MFIKPEFCKKCGVTSESGSSSWYIKKGYFKTVHNHQHVPRYQCKTCKTYFSASTNKDTYKQHKPKVNQEIFKLLSSGVTMRRTAKVLGISKNTVAKKMGYLARIADREHRKFLSELKTSFVQFDEMETFEHTRLKPIGIALAVRAKTGEIIDIEVASMKCHGKLHDSAKHLYGYREDTRDEACKSVFKSIAQVAKPNITIATDGKRSYQHYTKDVLPDADFLGIKRADQSVSDLWRINHVCAKLRADLARLHRRTWTTTKKMERLQDHLLIYTAWNNGYKL